MIKRSGWMFALFMFLLPVYSCTKTLYTTDLAKSCQTKDQVTKQFGTPDLRRRIGADEEWTYTGIALGVNPSSNNVKIDTLKKDSLNVYNQNRYIKFMIDTSDNVIGYKVNNVTSSKKVKVSAGKILGSDIVITILIGVALALTSKS